MSAKCGSALAGLRERRLFGVRFAFQRLARD
jgi:hypothetical protein